MKKRLWLLVSVLVVGLIVAGWSSYKFVTSLYNNIPEGELIQETTSPDGTYTVKIYFVKGSLTTGNAIRAEVELPNQKTRNIYWSYHENSATTFWVNNETIIINGLTLNVLEDSYDWRKSSNS